MKINLFSILLILFLTSCEKNTNTLEYYFAKIESKLTTEELYTLKIKQDSSLIEYITLDLGARLFRDSVHFEYANALDTLLHNEGIVDHKLYATYMAIHYRRNNEKIPYSKINSTIKDYFINQHDEEIRFYKKRSENAKLNFDKFECGDTICLFFPLENIPEGKKVSIYEGRYFNTTKQWSDTLLLKGILLEKNKEEFDFGSNIFGYSFQIKIFFLDKEEDLYSVDGNLELGYSFNLYLNLHQREIKYCN